MERWVGRAALVTGASSGIGAAACKRLVELGMVVVGCARNVDKIKVVVSLEELCSGFPTRSDTNRAIQPQKMARCLKFRI